MCTIIVTLAMFIASSGSAEALSASLVVINCSHSIDNARGSKGAGKSQAKCTMKWTSIRCPMRLLHCDRHQMDPAAATAAAHEAEPLQKIYSASKVATTFAGAEGSLSGWLNQVSRAEAVLAFREAELVFVCTAHLSANVAPARLTWLSQPDRLPSASGNVVTNCTRNLPQSGSLIYSSKRFGKIYCMTRSIVSLELLAHCKVTASPSSDYGSLLSSSRLHRVPGTCNAWPWERYVSWGEVCSPTPRSVLLRTRTQTGNSSNQVNPNCVQDLSCPQDHLLFLPLLPSFLER